MIRVDRSAIVFVQHGEESSESPAQLLRRAGDHGGATGSGLVSLSEHGGEIGELRAGQACGSIRHLPDKRSQGDGILRKEEEHFRILR